MSTQSLKNHLLIATPQMLDPNFNGTVTYICEHNEDGALGITVNRPGVLSLGEIFEQLELNTPSVETTVLDGGPVQLDRGFVLHNSGDQWQSSLAVTDSVCLTTSLDILEAISQGQGPSKCLIALGYSGWGAGQLERELTDNCWLTCPCSDSFLFDVPHEDKFKQALARLGIDAAQLSGQIGHA